MSTISSIPATPRTVICATAGQTALAVNFPLQSEADLRVTKITATGEDTVLTGGEDYSVSAAGNSSGGTVTLAAAAAAGDTYVIEGSAAAHRTSSMTEANMETDVTFGAFGEVLAATETAAEARTAMEVLFLSEAVQDRMLRFDKYRSIHASDQEAWEAILADAFSTTAIDTYGAFVDLCGFTLTVGPVDVAAVTGRTTNFKNITIMNGTLVADGLADWTPIARSRNCTITQGSATVTMPSTADIKPGDAFYDTSFSKIAIPSGIARGTHVVSVDSGTQITINVPAYRTVTHFFNIVNLKYFLDFSGFSTCSRVKLVNLNFRCNANMGGQDRGIANVCLMGQDGIDWAFMNIFAYEVPERVVTDWNSSASGCWFQNINAWAYNATEDNDPPGTDADRRNIGLVISSSDVKFANNRIINFQHAQVMHHGGYTIAGSHNWQGNGSNVKRTAAYVFTSLVPFATFTGNYIDNGGIELSNENGGEVTNINDITITGNIFTMTGDAATTSRYVTLTLLAYTGVDAAFGINGMTVTNNVFRKLVGGDGSTGAIPRVEAVETSAAVSHTASLNNDAINNLVWTGNTYRNITYATVNPSRRATTQGSAVTNYDFDFTNDFPFGLEPRSIGAVALGGLAGLKNASNATVTPGYTALVNPSSDFQLRVTLSTAAKGTVSITASSTAM